MEQWPLLYSFEGKMTADKAPHANCAFKNGLFSVNLGTKMITLFLQCTQSLVLKQQAILAIGTDGHCCTRLKGK
jgi:hypothetical protein